MTSFQHHPCGTSGLRRYAIWEINLKKIFEKQKLDFPKAQRKQYVQTQKRLLHQIPQVIQTYVFFI